MPNINKSGRELSWAHEWDRIARLLDLCINQFSPAPFLIYSLLFLLHICIKILPLSSLPGKLKTKKKGVRQWPRLSSVAPLCTCLEWKVTRSGIFFRQDLSFYSAKLCWKSWSAVNYVSSSSFHWSSRRDPSEKISQSKSAEQKQPASTR